MRQLAVYNNQQRAGLLTEQSPGRDYAFAYDADYLATAAPPISLTLPKRQEVYRSEHLFPFFTNMLPEGANRKVICRMHHLDESDFFGLLSATAGMDTIGAICLKRTES